MVKQLKVFDEFAAPITQEYRHSDAATKTQNHHRAASPSIEWIESIVHSAETSSQHEFFKILRGHSGSSSDHTVFIINQARKLISKVFPFTSSQHKPKMSDSKPLIADGPYKARASLYLYQRCLHKILMTTIQKITSNTSAPTTTSSTKNSKLLQQDAIVAQFLAENELQISLVNACVEIVTYAFTKKPEEESFPRATLKMGRTRQWIELSTAVTWILSSMMTTNNGGTTNDGSDDENGGDGVLGMPHDVFEYLTLIKQRILEELAFLPHSTLHTHLIKALESKKNNSTEMCTSSILIAKAIKDLGILIQERSGILSSALFDHATITLSNNNNNTNNTDDDSSSGDDDDDDDDHKQSATFQLLKKVKSLFADCLHALIDSLLSKHLDVMYDRHLSVIMASSAYFLAKVFNIPIKFQILKTIAVETLPCHQNAEEDIFNKVSLIPLMEMVERKKKSRKNTTTTDESDSDDEDEDDDVAMKKKEGTLREFYNTIYVHIINVRILSTPFFKSTSSKLKELLDCCDVVSSSVVHDDGVVAVLGQKRSFTQSAVDNTGYTTIHNNNNGYTINNNNNNSGGGGDHNERLPLKKLHGNALRNRK